MFDEFEGVSDAFSFGLVDGGASKSNSGHGGTLVIHGTLVGHLDMIGVVNNGLV